MRAPFFWSIAFEPTVVPWTISPTAAGAIPAARSRSARPVITARPGSFGVEEVLLTSSVPSGRVSTMSVKVPPMSTPTRTVCGEGDTPAAEGRGSRGMMVSYGEGFYTAVTQGGVADPY